MQIRLPLPVSNNCIAFNLSSMMLLFLTISSSVRNCWVRLFAPVTKTKKSCYLILISFSSATDEMICHFLRTRCYPSSQSQTLLGPLSKQLSVFSPFFHMVPLDESKPTSLPRCLETLNEELINSMSMNLLCSIM